jgi:hypothetical protein
MKKVFLSLATVIGLASFISLQNQQPANAMEPCGNPSGVGYQCYEDGVINARVGYGQTSPFSSEIQAGAGYVITRYEFINEAQFGSVNGPNIQKVQAGASVRIAQTLDQSSRELEENYNKASAEYKKVTAMAEVKSKFQREIDARREVLSKVDSNVDLVRWDGSVSGKCLRDTWIGCVDKGGGKLQGKVRVYKLYIGTEASVENLRSLMREELAKALALTVKENVRTPRTPKTLDPRTKMIISSYQEILERTPNQKEIDYWKQRISQTGETYDQILEVHRAWQNSGGK